MTTKTVLSLFSGCGGLDLGIEGGFTAPIASLNPRIQNIDPESTTDERLVKLPKTGFQTIFANDILKSAKTSWLSYFDNHNKDIFRSESIVELVNLEKSNSSKIFPSTPDLITGGFPCQDFSVAGKRRGFTSHKDHFGKKIPTDNPNIANRGQLYMWMREVIELTKPKMFIAENVKGLMNLNDSRDIIQNDFESVSDNGYLVLARLLHAGEYGVPQSRERIFFIGLNKSHLTERALSALEKNPENQKFDPFPMKTHRLQNRSGNLKHVNQKLNPCVTVKQLIGHLEEPEKSNDLSHNSYSKAKWYGEGLQGQTEVNMEGLGPTIRAEHHGNIEFRRLSEGHKGKNLEEIAQGLIERRLSVRECALLQTFPPEFEFVTKSTKKRNGNRVSASDAYRLIGNAVPPILGYNIGLRLSKVWPNLFGE
ncbi:DNA (cytosine-5-)-methyltransferase [Dehalococcoidia bacterium]|nr:DNA (cytosine-5-)-methyltransferase [Dehalococcoidia bacterium]